MILDKMTCDIILTAAKSYLGRPYSIDFDCVVFVREVYRKVGIEVPKLKSFAPPSEFNISKEELEYSPLGHLLFLKDPNDPRKERAWTHVGIIAENNSLIHCSLFLGRSVVTTPLKEIFKMYDYAKSKTT